MIEVLLLLFCYEMVIVDFYDIVVEIVVVYFDVGCDVVVICEGDLFFYGLYMYLYDCFVLCYDIEVIFGVCVMFGGMVVFG